MLLDQTDGVLQELKEYAEKKGALEALTDKLEYLKKYGKSRCTLTRGHALPAHSLGIHMEQWRDGKWVTAWHGGLVPSLADDAMQWNIHT